MDEEGKPVLKKGKPEPDSALRDTESIPFKEDIPTYMEANVLPFAPEAWIDDKKTKTGYEIPFTREFYKYIAQDSTIKPDVYVVFMSTPLTDKTQAKGNELAQRIGMEIKYWDKSTIDRLVRTNSIVKERFWKLLDS